METILFFHNSIKENNKMNRMVALTSLSGENLSSREDIANEILGFYTTLAGTASVDLHGIERPCVMKGKILSREDSLDLIKPVLEHEI